jgi:hypothetical protein
MSLWLIPVGIAAWFLVAIVAGLCVGPVLARCSQAQEAAAQPWMRASGAPGPTWNERQVPPGLLGAGAGIARRDQDVTL